MRQFPPRGPKSSGASRDVPRSRHGCILTVVKSPMLLPTCPSTSSFLFPYPPSCLSAEMPPSTASPRLDSSHPTSSPHEVRSSFPLFRLSSPPPLLPSPPFSFSPLPRAKKKKKKKKIKQKSSQLRRPMPFPRLIKRKPKRESEWKRNRSARMICCINSMPCWARRVLDMHRQYSTPCAPLLLLWRRIFKQYHEYHVAAAW